MKNELIQVFFDLATENIDWEKKKTRNSQHISNTPKQKHNIKQITTQNRLSVRTEMSENFSKFIADVIIRIDDYKQSGEKDLLKQLEKDYKILCVNFERFGRPQVMSSCIEKIRIVIHGNTKKTEKIRKQDSQKNIGMTDRGIEIQEELANLRDEVKRKDLNLIEKENLTNALLKLQKEINTEIDKFSKFDSIPIRLNQIDNYLEKLKNKEDIKAQPINHKNEISKETESESPKKRKRQVIWKFGL